MTFVEIQENVICRSSSKVEIEIKINSNAVAQVQFLDADNKPISAVMVYTDGSDFAENRTTDDILVNIILNKYGLINNLHLWLHKINLEYYHNIK